MWRRPSGVCPDIRYRCWVSKIVRFVSFVSFVRVLCRVVRLVVRALVLPVHRLGLHMGIRCLVCECGLALIREGRQCGMPARSVCSERAHSPDNRLQLAGRSSRCAGGAWYWMRRM